MSEQSNPEMVTLQIDDHEVTVPAGTNLIEAAKQAGIEISAFCYHPGLSVVAVCRQCLVSVEGSPKLVPACHQRVSEGMVARTLDPESTDARRQMLEFTLLNHPVDCPICDKAGECTLQKLYFDYDNKGSRVDVPKVHKPKVVDLGPHIVLDAERCILCTRCIRVCDEVAGQHQLEMANRGDHEELGTAPGEQLDNPYSINTVDVCPVGALTSKDFRFTLRAWELMSTPSICQGCSTGCNMEIHHRNGRTWRLVPRNNPQVNGHWMCDEGRFTYHSLRDKRYAGPVVEGLPSSWDKALAHAAELIRPALTADRASFGVVLSPGHTNEDNYALAKLATEIWQVGRVYIGGPTAQPERADDLLRDADVSANRRGVVSILSDKTSSGAAVLEDDLLSGQLTGLLVLGHDHALGEEALSRAGDLDCVVVVSDRDEGIAKHADVVLACSAWAEVHGTITNRDGLVQRMRAAYEPGGQSLPAWQILSRLAKACDATLAYDSPKAIFQEMIGKTAAFQNAEWGPEVPPIQLRFAHSRG